MDAEPSPPYLNKTAPARLDPVGIVLAMAGVAMFSSKSILIKLAYRYGVDPASLMTLRMGFSLPFYLGFGWFAYRQRLSAGALPAIDLATIGKTAAIGATGYYVASFLDLSGLQYISAQFERLILFTYPFLVVLFGALFFGAAVTRSLITALALSSAGVALIFAHDVTAYGGEVTKGTLLVFGSSLAFTFYLLFSKAQIEKLGSRIFTSLAMIAASGAIMLHFSLTHRLADVFALPWPVYGYALAMAVFATVIPSYLINEAVARIGPGPKSIIGTVGPVFTTIAAVFILGETFTLYHLAGMTLVVAGIFRLTWDKR